MKLIIRILLKNYIRSLQRGRLLLAKVIFTVLILISSGLVSILSGFLIASILRTHYPPEEAMSQFCFYFIFLLAIYVVLLPLFSDGHKMSLAAYFHLPVKKLHLAHLYQITNLANIWNGFLFLLVISFAGNIIYWSPNTIDIAYTLLLIGLILFTSELVIVFRFLILNWKTAWSISSGLLIVIIILALRYYKWAISTLTHWFQLTAHGNPGYVTVFICVGIFLYVSAVKMTYHLFYVDSFSSKRINLFRREKSLGKRNSAFQFGWLQIRQLLRTKRGPVFLFEGVVFNVWGFVYVVQAIRNNDLTSIILGFVLLFVITGISYVYQSYRFLGHCFDTIYLRSNGIEKLTKSSVSIAHGLATVNFILCLILAHYLDSSLSLLLTAIWVYSMGFSNYVFLYMATFETKAYDMNVNPFFNFEAGWKIYQLYGLVSVLIVLLMPISLLFIVGSITNLSYSLPLFLIGLVGLSSTKIWVKLIINNIDRRKYNMLDGFRST